jgi:hypothetical protein
MSFAGCGDFFVSTLTLKNATLREKPSFPILFMIHKTKQFERHENFFRIADRIFELSKYQNIPMTTDREKAITESVKRLNFPLVLCTNHIIRDVKFWISKNKSNGISKENGQDLIEIVKRMIYCETKSDFESEKLMCEEKFKDNPIILNYVKVRLTSDIENHSAKFITKKFKAFDGKAATSNQSEAFNYIIKSITEWKENSPDLMCLIFYYLQNYYLTEFSRASRNLGNYHINEYFPKNYQINTVDTFIPYENIIDHVKGKIINVQEVQQDKERKTSLAMARYSVENNFISHNSNLKCFTIRSFRDPEKLYVVKLNPKPTCTCAFKGKCYHILACQISIGNEDFSDKSSLNLSELTKAAEKTKYSKSGKKYFRKIDSQKNIENIASVSTESKPTDVKFDLDVSTELSSDNENSSTFSGDEITLYETDNKITSSEKNEIEFLEEKVKPPEEIECHFQNLRDKINNLVIGGKDKIWQRNKKRNLYPNINVELFEWADFPINRTLKNFKEPYESLNSGIWLSNYILDDAIQCLINKHKLDDFIGLLGINACGKILWSKDICYR